MNNYENKAYRYGFNGMERDDEVKGAGNSVDFGARIYDSRLGRLISTDRYESKYPYYSPYQFAGNNPILATDSQGDSIYIYDANKEVFLALDLLCETEMGRKVIEKIANSATEHIHIASDDFDLGNNSAFAVIDLKIINAIDSQNGTIDLSNTTWRNTKNAGYIDAIQDINLAPLDPSDKHSAVGVDEDVFNRNLNFTNATHILNATILYEEIGQHIDDFQGDWTGNKDHEKLGTRVKLEDGSWSNYNHPSLFLFFWWTFPPVEQKDDPQPYDRHAKSDYPQTILLKQLDKVVGDKIDKLEDKYESSQTLPSTYVPPTP